MRAIDEIDELKDFEKDLLLKCKELVKSIDSDSNLILYGSRARGDGSDDSDYDLLILTDNDATPKKEDLFRKRIYPVELETGWVITIMLYKKDTWNSSLYRAMPFRNNVEKEGISL